MTVVEEVNAAAERLLVVAAHPDDETLGAAALMACASACRVIHLTDGAPKDRSFMPAPCAHQARTTYALTRRKELFAALSLIGLSETDVDTLDITDQDAAFHLAALSHVVATAMRVHQPTVVITHAYEGGHPDHDAAAFAVWAAVELLERAGRPAPRRVEMALYHGAQGRFTAGRFLEDDGAWIAPSGELERVLSAQERARKHAMMRCFETQQHLLRPFYALSAERYRMAPEYVFAEPPHEGALLYERNGFPLDSARWRQLAHGAMRELKL